MAVKVTTTTDYPFRESVRVSVRAERPVSFPLLLRVPGWTEAATLRLSNGSEQPLASGAFHRIEREWSGETELNLRFPMKVRTSRRYNEALAVERGPLVYSLKLGEERVRVNEDKPFRELPHGDFEVFPTTPWNYGLAVDEARPETSIAFEERPVGDVPFSPEGAGTIARVKGRRLPHWKLEQGWAGEVPVGPQTGSGPLEDLVLIPYGCTNIRVTEFPRLKT